MKTISIQFKKYEIETPEYYKALNEADKTIEQERETWLDSLEFDTVWYNVSGEMLEYIKKGGTKVASYGEWINNFITLIKSEENNEVVGFTLNDINYLLSEAEKRKNNITNKHISYQNGIIIYVNKNKILDKLTEKEITPCLSLYYKGSEICGFKVNYKEILFLKKYYREKEKEYDAKLRSLDIREADWHIIENEMEKSGFKLKKTLSVDKK